MLLLILHPKIKIKKQFNVYGSSSGRPREGLSRNKMLPSSMDVQGVSPPQAE